MGDLSIFDPEYMQINAETDAVLNEQILISEPDEDVLNAILSRFNKPYSFKESVDLPVKSSASQVMKILGEDEPYATKKLFPAEMPEGSTSIESGIAYHRFLELCDFNEKSKEGVAA